MKKHLLLKLVTTCMILLGLSGIIKAQVAENISMSPKKTYMTIDAAITAAVAGQTIVIYPGTHKVNLTLTKNLTLGSKYMLDGNESWIAQTILDGSNIGCILSTSNNTVLLKGLTFKNGKATEQKKAACVNMASSTVSINKCTLENNYLNTSDASIINSLSSSLEVKNCTIRNTTSGPTPTYGINALNTKLTIEANKIYGNKMRYLIYSCNNSDSWNISSYKNNLIYKNTVEIVFGFSGQDTEFNHNTVVCNKYSEKVLEIDDNGAPKKNYKFLNSIFWGNTNSVSTETLPSMYAYAVNSLIVSDCFIENGKPDIRVFNVPTISMKAISKAHPFFADAANDNYALQFASPCIGFATFSGVTTDLNGQLRPTSTTNMPPDVGAIENTESNLFKAMLSSGVRYPSIQSAINAAKFYDEIIVYPGIHKENLVISSAAIANLKFTSYCRLAAMSFPTGDADEESLRLDIAEKVILDGMGTGRVVTATGSATASKNVSFELMTIQNGNTTGYGGGIYSDLVTIGLNSMIIKNNKGSYGGGLFHSMENTNVGTVYIENCRFENNNAVNSGGGAYLGNGGTFVVNNITMKGNSARNGGGLYVSKVLGITINRADFDTNSASKGSALYSIFVPSLTLKTSTIKNNIGDLSAIQVYDTKVNIENALIENNTSPRIANIYGMDNHYPVTMTNVLMKSNKVASELVYTSNVDLSATYTTLASNVYSSTSSYGLNFVATSNSPVYKLTCLNSILWDNSAKQIQLTSSGAALYASYSNIKNGTSGVLLTSGALLNSWAVANMKSADPLFDANAHLQDKSPCVGTAMPITSVNYDLMGFKRDLSGTSIATDMGAYENPIDNDNYAAKNMTKSTGYNFYMSIQDAIDAADYQDEILIFPGAKRANLEFNHKSLKMYSKYYLDGNKDWIDKTIVDGGYETKIMKDPLHSTFIGITFANGSNADACFVFYDGTCSFNNCNIRDCESTSNISLFETYFTTLRFSNCNIFDNKSPKNSLIYSIESSLDFLETKIYKNNAQYNLIESYTGSVGINMRPTYSTFRNCLFENNISSWSDLINIDNQNLTINHCTFANNSCYSIILSNESFFPHLIQNSIIYGNTLASKAIKISGGTGIRTVKNCLIQGGLSGISNDVASSVFTNIISSDPLFVNPANADFRISSTSPAVGYAIASSPAVTTDIKGNTRNQSSLDLGAYMRGSILKSAFNASEVLESADAASYGLVSEPKRINAYPIPMQNVLFISGDDVVETSIVDIKGATILQSPDKDVNVASLSPGNYIIKVRQSNGKTTEIKAVK